MKIGVKVCFYLLGLGVLFSVTGGAMARANLLEGAHIIHLVAEKIVRPVGLVVHQDVLVSKIPGVIPESKFEIEPEIEPDWDRTTETIWCSFPGRLRIQTVAGIPTTITLWSQDSFLKVVDGRAVATAPQGADFYLVPLFNRERKTLEQHLEKSGVDVTRSSLGRYGDLVCYVVGDAKKNDASTLWVDKETFFPVKYRLYNSGKPIIITYGNWQRVSRTWYPMEMEISLDDVSMVQIKVRSFELESRFSQSLFDVDHILDRLSLE